jgi:hypothetical protein
MNTAFGILLFMALYGRAAYLVYDEVSGRRSRTRHVRVGDGSVRPTDSPSAPSTIRPTGAGRTSWIRT